jgi:hypothetical protein
MITGLLTDLRHAQLAAVAAAGNVAVTGAAVGWFYPGWHINDRLQVARRATSGTRSDLSPEIHANERQAHQMGAKF